MKESRLCDPELFSKIKESVSMQQVVEYYGLQLNRKGLCLCPFHQDKDPSLKIYTNGKGFYCFTCGTGGDQIKFAALYNGISNTEAARSLAAAFNIQTAEPVTYREKREMALKRKKQKQLSDFVKRSTMYLKMYRILLCEARRDENDCHFMESIQKLEYVEYLLECLKECPEEVRKDERAVRRIGELEGRITDWYIRIEPDGTVSR